MNSNSFITKQLPIFSFLIRYQNHFLHYNYVCALLNDLFGIQSRGGCSCAGPFSQLLLGITDVNNLLIESNLLNKSEILRPGYTRLSFTYWMSEIEINYILNAIIFIANNGYKYLNLYRFNYKTGEWAHNTRFTKFPERIWLSNFNVFENNNSNETKENRLNNENNEIGLNKNTIFEKWNVKNEKELFDLITISVENELENINKLLSNKHNKQNNTTSTTIKSDFESMRWFAYSEDINFDGKNDLQPIVGPIQPNNENDWYIPQNYKEINENGNEIKSNEIILHENASLYAIKRNEKLTARIGGEGIEIPRYIQLMFENMNKMNDNDELFSTELIDSSMSSTSTSLLLTELIKSIKNISSSKITENLNQNNKNSNNNNIKTSKTNKNINKINDLNDSNDFKMKIVDETAVIETVSNDLTSDLVCTTGKCFLPRKKSAYESSNETNIKSNILITNTETEPNTVSKKLLKAITIPKKILKFVGQAIKDWNMIEEGDRLLLGLSGGKDSLSLLHILIALQKRAPIKFTIACATVDPQTESFDPTPLIPYLKTLGITYHYLSEPIVEMAKSKLQGDSLCSFCSRFKRGLLYSCCR